MSQLRAKGSRHFGLRARQRQAMEKQVAFEIEDARSIMNQGLFAQVRWLWINRMGWKTFFRGVFLMVRARVRSYR